MNLLKVKRVVDKRLLESIRQKNCLVCSVSPCEAHHVTSRGSGGGDTEDNLMPLCRRHHTEIHIMGNSRYVDKYAHVFTWFAKNNRADLLKKKTV